VSWPARRRLVAALIVMAGTVACGGSPTKPSPPPTTPTTPSTPTTPDPPPSTPTTPQVVPVLSKTNFVAFGDSLTEGVASIDPKTLRMLLASQTYPQRLQSMLASRYTGQTVTVANRGKAGEQAVDGLSRFIDVLRQDQPQVVLLLDGYNDLNVYGAKNMTKVVGAVESMVKECRARGIQVFVGTLPPERPGSAKALPSDTFEKYNSEITRMAVDKGATIVDLSHIVTLGAIGEDGLHPTDAGYEQLAAAYFGAIRTALETAQTTSTARPSSATAGAQASTTASAQASAKARATSH
jgi:lysophospholipase L1-like esterase